MSRRSIGPLPRELRHAVRALWKGRGFAAIAILSLALGIGANTALFALVDALLLRTLPVRDADRLVSLARVNTATGKYLPLDRDAIDALARLTSVVDGAGAYAAAYNPDLRIDSQPEPNRQVVRATGNLLTVVGARAAVGALQSETPAAVISERLWRERFAASPDVLSRSVTVDDRIHPIIGVAAAPFLGVSLDASVDVRLVSSQALTASSALIRTRAGVSIPQVADAAGAMFRTFDEQRGAAGGGQEPLRVEVVAARRGFSNLRDQYEGALRALMMLVGLVLLITCANLGNLLVARKARCSGPAAGWRRGSSRAGACRCCFRRFRSPRFRSSCSSGPTGGSSATCSPSRSAARCCSRWHRRGATRLDLTGTLKTSHVIGPALGSRRLAWWLVAGQTALSVVLSTCAGLFFQTVRNVTQLDLGFDARNLVQIEMRRDAVRLANLDPSGRQVSAEGVRRVYALLSDRIKAIPGVDDVSASFSPLLASYYVGVPQPEGPSGHMVGPGYFELLRIPVLRGRTFLPDDVSRAGGVAVVNESYERETFPGESAIGKRITVGTRALDVVGVVADAKLDNVRWNEVPRTFRLGVRESRPMEALLVRTRVDPDSVIRPLQHAIRDTVPGVLVSVRTLDDVISRSIARERMVAAASGLFAVLGLTLAGIGLFGIASYAISQRTSELGLRMALGATRWDVIRESLRETAVVFAAGVIAGAVAAAATTRLAGSMIAGLLFGLEPTDRMTIAAVVVVMTATAVAACVVPALRATRIDPLDALRYE